MIRVMRYGGVRTFPNEKLAEVCLQLCGGGWTAAQTKKAMALQAKVLETGRAAMGTVKAGQRVVIQLVEG